jgi:hypothetical protein
LQVHNEIRNHNVNGQIKTIAFSVEKFANESNQGNTEKYQTESSNDEKIEAVILVEWAEKS